VKPPQYPDRAAFTGDITVLANSYSLFADFGPFLAVCWEFSTKETLAKSPNRQVEKGIFSSGPAF
jgi:hypothetical protein